MAAYKNMITGNPCRMDWGILHDPAFMACMNHKEETDDIVRQIYDAIAAGSVDININIESDYSDQDIEDIINALIEELEK